MCMPVARLVALAALTSACVSNPTPCAAADVCADGLECLANRCVRAGGQPVPDNAQRQLLQLEQIGVWSNNHPSASLPPVVTLGDAIAENQLILRFAAPSTELHIQSAFLLLHPDLQAPPAGQPLQFTVRLLSAPWAGKGAPQHAGRIGAVGTAQPHAPFSLRIDVTEVARQMQRWPKRNYGVLITAEGNATPGASYQTGSMGGTPQFEVYALAAEATR
ncbi:MAG TPA: hypothetical protein VL137_00125 [Polyangiaceae bacterium]|nr:hypothetical protein [Polyangiaceae bacterium]